MFFKRFFKQRQILRRTNNLRNGIPNYREIITYRFLDETSIYFPKVKRMNVTSIIIMDLFINTKHFRNIDRQQIMKINKPK